MLIVQAWFGRGDILRGKVALRIYLQYTVMEELEN